jgi:hypothetical protein
MKITSSNSILTNLNSTKFFGITLDSMLTWKEHIANLTTKLNKACFAIRAIKPYITLKVLMSLFFLLSFSHVIWHHFLGLI